MIQKQILRVRAFNRFYTNVIGLLEQRLLQSPFSLPEARVLYEMAQRKFTTASEIQGIITIDRGYLSRIIAQFIDDGLISRKKSVDDGRSYLISLTEKGRKTFTQMNEA